MVFVGRPEKSGSVGHTVGNGVRCTKKRVQSLAMAGDWTRFGGLLVLFLGQDLVDNVAKNVGQAEISARVAVGQLLVVEPQQVQHGGVQVVGVPSEHYLSLIHISEPTRPY